MVSKQNEHRFVSEITSTKTRKKIFRNQLSFSELYSLYLPVCLCAPTLSILNFESQEEMTCADMLLFLVQSRTHSHTVYLLLVKMLLLLLLCNRLHVFDFFYLFTPIFTLFLFIYMLLLLLVWCVCFFFIRLNVYIINVIYFAHSFHCDTLFISRAFACDRVHKLRANSIDFTQLP